MIIFNILCSVMCNVHNNQTIVMTSLIVCWLLKTAGVQTVDGPRDVVRWRHQFVEYSSVSVAVGFCSQQSYTFGASVARRMLTVYVGRWLVLCVTIIISSSIIDCHICTVFDQSVQTVVARTAAILFLFQLLRRLNRLLVHTLHADQNTCQISCI